MSISVQNLTYHHSSSLPPALVDINFSLAAGSRTLIIGANGAGKSTLLHILAGRKLVTAPDAQIRIMGRDVFRDFPPGVSLLSTEWAMNPVVRGDISVAAFLDSVGGYRHKDRRNHLLDLLDIDLDWRMHHISDGERRRVQLCFGLMVPWDVLLLDEVTVDLDVLVRHDLLNFLKSDSETRNASIVYATHIFDGLDKFPTYVAHVRFGSLVMPPIPWSQNTLNINNVCTSLYDVALSWLRDDRELQNQQEKLGHKRRGARQNDLVPSDSETFYKKYDYSHT